jgi:hypothetical protein
MSEGITVRAEPPRGVAQAATVHRNRIQKHVLAIFIDFLKER